MKRHLKIANCHPSPRIQAMAAGVSAVALLLAAPALAQSTPAPANGQSPDAAKDTNVVVVTGIRNSYKSAAAIKRKSDTVVDAITADDIGALPDKNVTETLQRIPGIQVNRFQAVNDPDHVSEQGQSPAIRGLPYVTSQFNGRDAFTANRGRALDFQSIPPDLASRIEVYKNQTADQIEGGIAGNVNIVTRLPLDTKRDFFAININANNGDQRKKTTPEAGMVFSKQWDTSLGRFGVLGSASDSKIDDRVNNARVTTYRDYRNADTSRNIAALNGGVTGGAPGVDYYIPLGSGYSQQDVDHDRVGYSAALQWESNDKTWMGSLQYIHANTTEEYLERTIAPVEDTGNVSLIGGVSAGTFNGNNVLLKGTIGNGDGTGVDTQELTRGEHLTSSTNDFAGHLKWNASEKLHFDFDAQYVKSDSSTLDTSVVAISDPIYLFDNTGNAPVTTFKQAAFYNLNYSTVPYASVSTNTSATADPKTTFWRSAQDHEDNTTGDEFAFRADGGYDFNDGSLLRRVKFGARYAERKQTIRSDGYNWGNLSERWNAHTTTASDALPWGYGLTDTAGIQTYGFLGNPALNYAQLQAGVQQIKAVHPSYGYQPLYTGSRNGSGVDLASIANGAGDGFHNLGEISTNRETTSAAYIRADFSSKDWGLFGDVVVDGNVGVRYVHTESESSGYYTVPNAQTAFQGYTFNTDGTINCTVGRTGGTTQFGYNPCLNTPAERAALLKFFGTGSAAYTANTTTQSYNDVLPSINIRVAPTNDLQFRFAYSKGISRPSFNDLRNYTAFGLVGPTQTLTQDQPYPMPALVASSYGNPLLRPTKSDNFDLTFEDYYSPDASITVALFYKKLTNIYSVLNGIATSNGGVSNNIGVDPATPSILTYTNNGQTLQAYNSVTANNDVEHKIKGVEFAIRQDTFAFLPDMFSGFGGSLNITYIDADPLANQPVLPANYTPVSKLETFAFPGISKYSYNAELFYEQHDISARLAYNWRAKYFVSSQDSLGPNDPTYVGDSGFLDGQVFYSVNSHLKIGFTGSNLTDTVIKTYNVINASGLQALRATNKADRRITFGLRLTY